MKGPKLDLQGGPLLISSGSTFWPFFKHVSFAGGSKTGPSTDWIRCLLGGPVLSPPKHLLQLRETHQRHTNQHRVGNKGLEGRPQLRLKNHISLIFFVRARCLSAGLRSWVLLADKRGIEPPPAVCQRHKNATIPTEPRGRLKNYISLRWQKRTQS